MADSDSDATCCVLVFCGLPGSGKSTLAHQLVAPGVVHICYDDLITPAMEGQMMLASQSHETESLWKMTRTQILRNVDNLVAGITCGSITTECTDAEDRPDPWGDNRTSQNDTFMDEAPLYNIKLEGFKNEIDEKFNIITKYVSLEHTRPLVFIIDDNMYYRSMRYQYYQLARKYRISFGEVLIKCSIDEALQRNRQRENVVADDVIIDMAAKFEPPDKQMFSWEGHAIILESDQQHKKEAVLSLIGECVAHPVDPPASVDVEAAHRDRVICSQNKLHQIDKILRRIVSQRMSSAKETINSKNQLGQRAKHCNEVRTDIMDSLRSGQLLIPDDESEMTSGNPESLKDSKDYQSILFDFVTSEFDKRDVI